MPTGYTCIITEKSDTTFETFALRCARAFGVCVEMREESLDTPPPMAVQMDGYLIASLREAEANMRELEIMTPAEAARRADAEYESAVASWTESKVRVARKRALYDAMLKQAIAWEPPTKDHEGLKKFMVEQIQGDIQIECGDPSSYTPTVQTGAEWLAYRREYAARTLKNRRDDYACAEKHMREGTEWLRALRASLVRAPNTDVGC